MSPSMKHVSSNQMRIVLTSLGPRSLDCVKSPRTAPGFRTATAHLADQTDDLAIAIERPKGRKRCMVYR